MCKNCPAKALSYEGEAKDVDEVVKVCLQDIDFYEESGGGVTISGGEGMVQPDFVKALLAKLKNIRFILRLRQLDISIKRFLENWLRCLTCFCLT